MVCAKKKCGMGQRLVPFVELPSLWHQRYVYWISIRALTDDVLDLAR